MEIIAAVVLFAACFAGMAIGVILSDRELKGSCGASAALEDDASCGACTRQEADLCPSDEPLVRLAQIAHPNPKHHR